VQFWQARGTCGVLQSGTLDEDPFIQSSWKAAISPCSITWSQVTKKRWCLENAAAMACGELRRLYQTTPRQNNRVGECGGWLTSGAVFVTSFGRLFVTLVLRRIPAISCSWEVVVFPVFGRSVRVISSRDHIDNLIQFHLFRKF